MYWSQFTQHFKPKIVVMQYVSNASPVHQEQSDNLIAFGTRINCLFVHLVYELGVWLKNQLGEFLMILMPVKLSAK
ncbi:hypothetical protein [Schleiferia thermophila]|uniref:hypothetical protein n=2 Tax=Schleiferia thermophila TaxID=884107 RepID=UPI0004E74CA9|nr:hypothetical protein AT05_00160 [Schleiferia thermophila str. Yellowstone]